jgi:hypothetical protein
MRRIFEKIKRGISRFKGLTPPNASHANITIRNEVLTLDGLSGLK